MAGTTLDRELTAADTDRVPFALATQADDADIRCLLRENPIPGQISLTLEREPNYFKDADLPETDKQTIIANQGGRVVCVGNCSIRRRFVNGEPRRVGYLGGLRLDARVAGRFDILRRGYRFFRELQADQPADFYFTSIASDNVPARKFLERGIPGMPKYEFVGEFLTILLPVEGRSPIRPAPKSDRPNVDELLNCLDSHGRQFQFAECWTPREITSLQVFGLPMERFHCVRDTGGVGATAAIWDQRAFKQAVIRGYAPWLALARPAINFAARAVRAPGLPPVGSTLAQAFVSHLAVRPEKPDLLVELIASLRTAVSGWGIEFLTMGFSANDARLATLRGKFRYREYRSRIYVVRWPGLGGAASELDGRCLGPEVALL